MVSCPCSSTRLPCCDNACVRSHRPARMCKPLWSGHLIPVRLLDDCIVRAVFPPTATLRSTHKSPSLFPPLLSLSCRFAKKSNTITIRSTLQWWELLSICTCERVPACQVVGWRWRELDGELTLSIQQGLVGTFWISFNGLFTRLSRIIAGIYEINKFFSHDPGWHGHRGRFFWGVRWREWMKYNIVWKVL